ncbi:CAP domain-containing protein [Streptomyces sp. NPDC093094]|uniref:CAP domain-containing protein n=1 Tax=Streptomyces sp. NPDC093094 TaxID=3366026 RepID=UPI00381C4B59
MGRHRRSDAGRATGGSSADISAAGSQGPRNSYGGAPTAPGIAPYLGSEAYDDAYARSDAYLYAPDDSGRMTGYGDGFAGPALADTAVIGMVGGPLPDEDPHRMSHVSEIGSFRIPDNPVYQFEDEAARRAAVSHRRPKKTMVTPVRTGLLGVSAAVAIGAVAVAAGVLPGGENYRLGGGSDNVQSADSPSNVETQQGGTSGTATEEESREPGSTSRGSQRSVSPTTSAPAAPAPSASAAPTEAPQQEQKENGKGQGQGQGQDKAQGQGQGQGQEKSRTTPSEKPKTPPTQKAPKTPAEPTAPVTVSAQAAAEAEVLRLVNVERENAGCSPVAANSGLGLLARSFSEDMAIRGFFDHTDPEGASPWDRADKAGIVDLGGENIARGQADAAAVMDAWMNSPGHRANILNCDFKTLGVGVHFADGGPWWTQDFGY